MSDEDAANRLIRLARDAHGPPDGAKARILARIRSGTPPASPPPEGGPGDDVPSEGASDGSGPSARPSQPPSGQSHSAASGGSGEGSSAPSGPGRVGQVTRGLVMGAVALALIALVGFLTARAPSPAPPEPPPRDSGARATAPHPIERPRARPRARPSGIDPVADPRPVEGTATVVDEPVEPTPRVRDRAERPPHPAVTEAEPASQDPTTEASTAEAAPPLDELALLARAQRELRGRDLEATLASVAAHREQFPASVFAVERDTLEALANCDLGRVEQARRIGGRVLRDHPSAPSAQRLRDRCVPSGSWAP